MFNRPSTQTNQGTINKFIGSAYNDLKVIIENIDTLKSLAEVYPFTLAYLGTDVNPPTARVDGSALQDGDYYLDTTKVGGAVTYYDLSDNTWFSIDPGQILVYANSAETNATSASDDAAAIAGVLGTVNSQAAKVAEDTATVTSNTSTVVGAAEQVATNTGTVTTLTADAIEAKELAVASAGAASESEVTTVNKASEVATALSSINTTAEDIARTVGVANTAAADAVAAAEALEVIKNAPTKAEYFANCAAVDAGMNGSGFLHWGKYYSGGAAYIPVNEGMWSDTGTPNLLAMGPTTDGVFTTSSKSEKLSPVLSVLGDLVGLGGSGTLSVTQPNQVGIKLPPAPDGLDKKDGTGRFTDLAEAIVAGGSDLSASVITRDDFVFVEVWYEAIGEKDMFCPLGSVQYGANTWDGEFLSNANLEQGYCAFGEWDTTTKGYAKRWSTMSSAVQAKFIVDHRNGIYSDNGVLIQRRFRIRSVKGLGNDWTNVNPNTLLNPSLTFDNGLNHAMIPRGSRTDTQDLGGFTGSNGWYTTNSTYSVGGGVGMFHSVNSADTSAPTLGNSHNGMCYAIPLALVSRRNQGAYHPVLNSGGCSTIWGGSGHDSWNDGDYLSSVADCFDIRALVTGKPHSDSGFIAAGHSGRPDNEFYDAIYAGDLKDLRKSCRKIPHAELLNRGSGMAIAAEHRGFEGCPFTRVVLNADTFTGTGGASSGGKFAYLSSLAAAEVVTVQSVLAAGNKVLLFMGGIPYIPTVINLSPVNSADNYIYYKNLDGSDATYQPVNGEQVVFITETPATSKSAEPTWTTLIGSVQNIAATFPDGVIGEWCPVIPDGTSKEFLLGRKVSKYINANITDDNGVTWINSAGGAREAAYESPSNSHVTTIASNRIEVVNYKTKARMTQDSVNGKVLAIGDVYAGSKSDSHNGGGLVSSLVGKVTTGVPSAGSPKEDYTNLIHAYRDGGLLYGGDYAGGVSHNALNITGDSPAAKCLFTLGSNNGVAVLRIPFKEMVWDSEADNSNEFTPITAGNASTKNNNELYYVTGSTKGRDGAYRCVVSTSTAIDSDGLIVLANGSLGWSTGGEVFARWLGNGWGDDNKFQIANGTNVMQDDNGNDVIYGIHEIELDAFIDESEL